MRPLLLTAPLLATPAPAQHVSNRSVVTGTATVSASGTDHTLYAFEDRDGGRDVITIPDMSPILVCTAAAAPELIALETDAHYTHVPVHTRPRPRQRPHRRPGPLHRPAAATELTKAA